MTTLPELPYGDPDFRLRAAGHACDILGAIMVLETPNGDLGNTLTLGPPILVRRSAAPGVAQRSVDERHDDDLGWLVFFLDSVGGDEGVDEIVRALGPDADADTHGVLVEYFHGLGGVAQDLENGVYSDLRIALTELETLQEDLDDALGRNRCRQ